MTQDNTDSRTPHSSTEDLLNDYLSDMFGSDPVPVSKPNDSSCSSAEHTSENYLNESSAQISESAHVSEQENISADCEFAEEANLTNEGRQNQGGSVTSRKPSHVDSVTSVTRVASEPQCAQPVLGILGGSTVKTTEAISPDLSLIPTIKMVREDDDQSFRSQCEAQIVLLTFLYYLRKPLSPRVRQCFLDYSEQAIDDYYAALWLAEQSVESVR